MEYNVLTWPHLTDKATADGLTGVVYSTHMHTTAACRRRCCRRPIAIAIVNRLLPNADYDWVSLSLRERMWNDDDDDDDRLQICDLMSCKLLKYHISFRGSEGCNFRPPTLLLFAKILVSMAMRFINVFLSILSYFRDGFGVCTVLCVY